ncbi:MAG: DNA-binding transcriptional regulator OxyR [Pseudopedobacter saltans]|uniref:DNA-binding transcriptional regulator OxyR n=1 Tax=Pseudopedobacter saltans TaxID=151895 RepID=A0A2W5H934_9SPHI|nr:MAG: DNA-binding transcriptional regulator OxyR [Pseudopedobacter saltans]
MTFTQLEYIVAVNTYRHFATAAENCFVTQPTLSMQIQKLEEELGIKIFDRSKQPVIPTEAGEEIIQQAKVILQQRNDLLETIASKKGIVNGELRLGIIPTLAPYLIPLFVPTFSQKFPMVKMQIVELTTENLLIQLKEGKIDAGVVVTPLNENGIKEEVLFYEKLMAYVSERNDLSQKEFILSSDIDPNKLWLLEEGHCFRSQIINLCELRRKSKDGNHFEYEAGSLETLRRMVDIGDGITILPELATYDLNKSQKSRLRQFQEPAPVREVSIVTHRDFVKKKLVAALKKVILDTLPEPLKHNELHPVVPID